MGAELLLALLQEINSDHATCIGLPLHFHIQTKLFFEANDLLTVTDIALVTLHSVFAEQKSNHKTILQVLLTITESILSWKFYDEESITKSLFETNVEALVIANRPNWMLERFLSNQVLAMLFKVSLKNTLYLIRSLNAVMKYCNLKQWRSCPTWLPFVQTASFLNPFIVLLW